MGYKSIFLALENEHGSAMGHFNLPFNNIIDGTISIN
jgi:hypothetical protein